MLRVITLEVVLLCYDTRQVRNNWYNFLKLPFTLTLDINALWQGITHDLENELFFYFTEMTLMWSFAIILILSLFHSTTCSITEDNNDEKGTTAGIEIIDGPNLNTSVIKGIMFHVSQYLKSFSCTQV